MPYSRLAHLGKTRSDFVQTRSDLVFPRSHLVLQKCRLVLTTSPATLHPCSPCAMKHGGGDGWRVLAALRTEAGKRRERVITRFCRIKGLYGETLYTAPQQEAVMTLRGFTSAGSQKNACLHPETFFESVFPFVYATLQECGRGGSRPCQRGFQAW